MNGHLLLGLTTDIAVPLSIAVLYKTKFPDVSKLKLTIYSGTIILSLILTQLLGFWTGAIYVFYAISSIFIINHYSSKIPFFKAILISFMVVWVSRDFYEFPYLIQQSKLGFTNPLWFIKILVIFPILYILLKPHKKRLLLLSLVPLPILFSMFYPTLWIVNYAILFGIRAFSLIIITYVFEVKS